VDARLHQLQGEAKGVTSAEQLALLQDFARDRLALFNRHVEGATRVADYENNNTYQYIVAREEMHLGWLRSAIEDLSGEFPASAPALAVPSSGESAILEDDVRQAQAFVDRWRNRIETLPNARHRLLLRVILGEVLEHTRFFEQALAGRDDVLGRRMPGASTGGGVLPVRWME
jgi:hypothetical protein